jgi:hypothetical protein
MSSQRRLDTLQAGLLLWCAVDASFFLYYLLRFEVPGQNTISDSLFSDGAYLVIMAVLLAVRLTFGVLFLMRFSNGWGAWESLGIAGMCVTFLSW